MPHAEGSVDIAQPAQTVFDFVADGRNNARWRPAVTDCEPAGDGRWRQGMKGPGGRRVDADYEVTESVPGRRYAFRVVAGPVRPTGSYDFEPAGNGTTRVRFALDWQPKGLKRLMAPMVARQMPKEVAQLERLKQVLESG